jgi:amino acid adenylation domain-containing protein
MVARALIAAFVTMDSNEFRSGRYAAFNQSESQIPPASTDLVHHLIYDHAKAHPETEAVVSWDCSFSYGHLESSSNRLAAHLVAMGVKPETAVPLLFEKSGWAVVAMLAVMKAGGAFLSLDVSQPDSRIRSIIADSGATVALCSATYHALCSSLLQNAFPVASHTMNQLKVHSIDVWPAALNNAAYVMATSGSTGSPKLVVTEHSQLSSFVKYLTEPLGFTDQTRTFQFASYAFDPVIGDTFLTLAAGGTLCIPSEHQRKSDIVGAMNDMQVNLAKFTPSLIEALTELTPARVPKLKTLILGGESTPIALLDRWTGEVDVKLIYGSTECTVSCMVQTAASGAVLQGEIGRACGSQAWVFNVAEGSDLRLTADGDIGELFIAGPLVARGYLNNPIQTEARFIGLQAHRVYRTGDLVRRLGDGRLVFVGRRDNQVKIRGQRLELEEVEDGLRKCIDMLPNLPVKSILVDAAMPLGKTSKQLVAFLSLGTDTPFDTLHLVGDKPLAPASLSPTTKVDFTRLVSSIVAGLAASLPSYMIPSLWVPIDEMPYTMSRKRDRQRLRQAVQSLPVSVLAAFSGYTDDDVTDGREHGDAATLSEQESLLRQLWADALSIDPRSIRPSHDFFHLGGNSLLVMSLISLARRTHYQLLTDDVFAHPTLRDLAHRLVPSVDVVAPVPFSLLNPPERLVIRQQAAQQCCVGVDDFEDILPLYSMQHYYIFGDSALQRDLAEPWNWQQQIVFELPEMCDIPHLKKIWNDAVQRHSQLRTRVVRSAQGVFQAILRASVGPVWREVDGSSNYVRLDRESVMSFGHPLLRLAIVRSRQQQHFILTMQHLIYDAFSRDLLFEELGSAYNRQTTQLILPPPMSRFIAYINGQDRRPALEFWESYLAGSSTKPLLSKALGSRVGAIETMSMILEKPPLSCADYTLATTIEVCVALAVARILHCDDVVFCSDRAGRNLPVCGIQDLVAPTTLFLPLRVRIDRQQTVHDLLRVHQAANVAMMPYEYVGWTELKELDQFKGLLQHSLNININPYTPLDKLGANMGLKVVDEHESWGDPFAINVSVRQEELEVAFLFDESFVPQTTVEMMMEALRTTFRTVHSASTGPLLTVGSVLDTA